MPKRQLKTSLPLLSKLWRQSQTKFWAYTQGTGALLMAGLSQVSDLVNDPHMKDYLSNFNVPKKVYIILATMALITWLVHGREHDA